jgi:tartrate-resistant acid phosphatase type 5
VNQLSHLRILFEEIVQKNLTWLLVVGHYPIFSFGEHGDLSELREYLLPLLIEYNVTLYLCGHDHISEHLQCDSPPALSSSLISSSPSLCLSLSVSLS